MEPYMNVLKFEQAPQTDRTPAHSQFMPDVTDAWDLNNADYSRLLAVWGNGHAVNGLRLFQAVSMRILHARNKHPIYAKTRLEAIGVIRSELDELAYAIAHESPARQLDEALDVLVTALRFLNNEIQENPKA